MAKGDPDPRVTDLGRVRKARERARRASPPKPAGSQAFLGSRPRAGLILVAILAVMAALWVVPALL